MTSLSNKAQGRGRHERAYFKRCGRRVHIRIGCRAPTGALSASRAALGLERDALRAEAKRRERGGENVYLDPYSHIDQSLVEVRLARDNNDPDLGTRHVSVLLSSRVIDPVGLLSAAWIHSRASSPRHTAVTRHKEGSISTVPRCLLPHLHAPSESLHQPPGKERGRGDTRTQKTMGREGETERARGRGKNKGEKGGEKVRVDSVTAGDTGATPRFHLKSRRRGSSSASRQHRCLCSRAYITTWLRRHTEGKTISRSGKECTRPSIEPTEGGGKRFLQTSN